MAISSASIATRESLTQIIKKLGAKARCSCNETLYRGIAFSGQVTEDGTECTHVVVEDMSKRTLKLLGAIARGSWVVSPEWVFRSLDQGAWVDETL